MFITRPALMLAALAVAMLSGCRDQFRIEQIACTIDGQESFSAQGAKVYEDDGSLKFWQGTSWDNAAMTVHRLAPNETCTFRRIAPSVTKSD